MSLSEGKLFTRFIGPPTSICLQPTCLSKRRRLSIHNDPVNVTIFTLKGPVPSIKVTLRCHHCMTKYNYSMWGSKQSEGEQFYLDEKRPLIEVSDTVYVERNIYQLFSTLRSDYKYIHDFYSRVWTNSLYRLFCGINAILWSCYKCPTLACNAGNALYFLLCKNSLNLSAYYYPTPELAQ